MRWKDRSWYSQTKDRGCFSWNTIITKWPRFRLNWLYLLLPGAACVWCSYLFGSWWNLKNSYSFKWFNWNDTGCKQLFIFFFQRTKEQTAFITHNHNLFLFIVSMSFKIDVSISNGLSWSVTVNRKYMFYLHFTHTKFKCLVSFKESVWLLQFQTFLSIVRIRCVKTKEISTQKYVCG